jgi:DNA-binding NarL/FixJ family response regulator
MPEMDGIQFCNKARSLQITAPIIMLSMYEDPNIIKEAFRNNAKGYLSKNTEIEEMTKAIKLCLAGEVYVNKKLLKKERKIISEDKFNLKYKLSSREREILLHMLKDEKNSIIADSLCISRRTVETHRKNILVKLDVKTNIGLAQLALKYKLSESLS